MNAKYNDPIMPLFSSLEILPYPKMQKQARLHFMHGIEYQLGPVTFSNTWTKNENRNLNYELRNADLFATPRVNYVYLKNAPFFAFPAEWNTWKWKSDSKETNVPFKKP